MESAEELVSTWRAGDMCEAWETSTDGGQTAISKWRFKRCGDERADATTLGGAR